MGQLFSSRTRHERDTRIKPVNTIGATVGCLPIFTAAVLGRSPGGTHSLVYWSKEHLTIAEAIEQLSRATWDQPDCYTTLKVVLCQELNCCYNENGCYSKQLEAEVRELIANMNIHKIIVRVDPVDAIGVCDCECSNKV